MTNAMFIAQQAQLTDALNQSTLHPAAACGRCGGWTSFGGMSQHSTTHVPVNGRFGCVCNDSQLSMRIIARLNRLSDAE